LGRFLEDFEHFMTFSIHMEDEVEIKKLYQLFRNVIFVLILFIFSRNLLGLEKLPEVKAKQAEQNSFVPDQNNSLNENSYYYIYQVNNSYFAYDPKNKITIDVGITNNLPRGAFISRIPNNVSEISGNSSIILDDGFSFLGGVSSNDKKGLIYIEKSYDQDKEIYLSDIKLIFVDLISGSRITLADQTNTSFPETLLYPILFNLEKGLIVFESYDQNSELPYSGVYIYTFATNRFSKFNPGNGEYNSLLWISPDNDFMVSTGIGLNLESNTPIQYTVADRLLIWNTISNTVDEVIPGDNAQVYPQGWISQVNLNLLINGIEKNISPLVAEAYSGFQRPMVNDHYGFVWLDWTSPYTPLVYHPGYDYNGTGNDCGTDILAVADGVVKDVNLAGWGTLVIEHNWRGTTVYSQYGHISSSLVSVGNTVTKGQHIAEVGSTGTASCHLHWEIRQADHPAPTNSGYYTTNVLNVKSNVENYYEDSQWWVDNHGSYSGSTDNPPAGFTKCADESYRCNFSGTADVVFGARNSFTSPRSFSNGVDCNNTVFGDPISGVGKACYKKSTGGGGSSSWAARYFNGADHWWDNNNFGNEMCQETINSTGLDKNYGSGAPCNNSVSDNWVGEYNATINFSSGNYVFQTDHDDGMKVWINGQNILDAGGSGSSTSCPARSLSGNVPIRIILREEGGDAHVKLLWSTNTSPCDLPGAFGKSGPSNGTTGQPISLTLSWGGSGGASNYSYCYDSTNDNACNNNNWVGVGTATNASISGLSAGTKYYWHVRSNNNGGDTYSDGNTWWSFTIQPPTPVGDSYEPDNTSAQAKLITPGSPQTHSIVPAGDLDWVKFTLTSQSAITLETYGPTSSDTLMYLYNSSLNQVELSDDEGVDNYSYIDRLCGVDALPAGTYYVLVNEFGNDQEIPAYNLTFNITQTCGASSSKAKNDFDGDGKTDPAKFVGGSVWYLKSSTGSMDGKFIGNDGAYVTGSDFDGDGKADPAKFVTSAGAIWYLKSSTGSMDGKYLGNDGAYTTASDFDGDGKADPARFVASAGAIWYLKSSTGSMDGKFIGSDGTYVAGSDFDGDGKTDPAKLVGGSVWYLKSSTGTMEGKFIGSDGLYVTGSDFDGDGKTDPAKFVGGSVWYLKSSTGTMEGQYIGVGGTYVTASDFDGDGKTDPARFLNGTVWYLKSSTGTMESQYIGTDGTYKAGN